MKFRTNSKSVERFIKTTACLYSVVSSKAGGPRGDWPM